MNQDDTIRILEQTKSEVLRFINELDSKLAQKEIDGIEYHLLLNEKLCGKGKDEVLNYIDSQISAEKSKQTAKEQDAQASRRKKIITFSAAAIILLLIAIIGIIYTNPGVLTGYATATKQVQETITYDRTFSHYTETQLDFTNLTSLKVSGTLEGSGAKIKLRINGVDYLVADISNSAGQDLLTGMVTGEPGPEYSLTTDKASYAIGETAQIIIAPAADNYSLYISSGEETHKLDTNTFTPTTTGDYQVVALIVLPNDILRLETNFIVTEQTTEPVNQTTNETANETINETNTTIPETPTSNNIFTFENLCTDTCSIPENDNPILIIEPNENATLTISTLTITQNKENQAPTQTKTIPDITISLGQATVLDLNKYFTDPDGDSLMYDINSIPDVNTTIQQNELTITSETPGVYTAYIYATDGDKLTTSNTFQITIGEGMTTNETNQTEVPATNETISVSNETNLTSITSDPCSNPTLNLRPTYCFENVEDKAFADLVAPLDNAKGETVGRFSRLGNLIIRGVLVQNATGEPGAEDFRIGNTAISGFQETTTYAAWIANETGDLYLRGQIYEEQPVIVLPNTKVYAVHNKFGIMLGYFDALTGDLYLKGNLVQLGKI